jgi:hypothetical protein
MLRTARLVLWALIVGNWLCVACFAAFLIASLPFAGVLIDRFAFARPAADGATVLAIMRGILAIGILAGFAAHILFSRLLAMVRSALQGDPFIRENSRRLAVIAWALLAIQLLDLGYGALSLWVARLLPDMPGWTFSVGGWIAVLMVFVLARVFETGARMREDLAMTV